MQNLGDEVLPLQTIVKILAVLLLLAAICIAQAPANTPGYLDPLPQDTGAAGLKAADHRTSDDGHRAPGR